ncbi:hypothetical protein BB559_006995 [Furculomyces boomerangus]|uniref:Uncharacterized protein n=2 Tax=Harpellales TaxID=61421 RepID=A0A2T9XZF9_9FUNG|nr:hypothetical protein BB559_006995 [Furculomyces boomerangus]PWA01231.1 hypothetical protein BB558_002672 [Smittium angustum]
MFRIPVSNSETFNAADIKDLLQQGWKDSIPQNKTSPTNIQGKYLFHHNISHKPVSPLTASSHSKGKTQPQKVPQKTNLPLKTN